MATNLAQMECVPCEGGVPPLPEEERERLLEELGAGWTVVDGHHLEKAFEFEDWASAQEFVNRVGDLAEAQGHHPDLHLSWGRVGVELWTHAIDGLTESDFVMAAKIEEI